MKKTTLALLALALTFAMLFSACGGSTASTAAPASGAEGTSSQAMDAEPTQDEAAGDEALTIGLILGGSANDNGWNATAYGALLELEEVFGASVNYVENVELSDVETQLINYGEEGYDIVFAHGFEYADGVSRIAPQFPETWFAVTSTDFSQGPNALGILQDNFQKGFLAGVVGALISETGTIGTIGGTDIPPVQDSVLGVEAGAKFIDPEIEVLTAITGDNEDSTTALEVSNSMIEQGADVLVPVLGSAGLAVLTAAEEGGVLVVGTNSDMHEFGPEVVVTSSLAGFTKSMVEIVQLLQDGELEAKAYNFGVAEGVVELTSFYEFEDTLPPEVLEEVQSVTDDIASGDINTEEIKAEMSA